MRTPTLKSYLKNNFNDYFNKFYKNEKRTVKNMQRLSKLDTRLAEVAQSYYMAKNMPKKANLFKTWTKESFKDFNTYSKSDSKYVYLFRSMQSSWLKVTDMKRSSVLLLQKKLNLSTYKLSKLANTNQSNVKYFLEGDNKKLSEEKVNSLLKLLNDYKKNLE